MGAAILLYQLADSAFPIGGFAYSCGLESAVKQSFVYDQESLRAYLHSYSQQILSLDLPFITSSFLLNSGYEEALIKMAKCYSAMLLNPSIQKSGAVIGRNWLRICQQLTNIQALEQIETVLTKAKLSCDFTVIYGLSMKIMGYDLLQTKNLYFYMMLRDQISALIRLNVSGPTRAHEELFYFLNHYNTLIENLEPTNYELAYKTTYSLEIVQLTHDRIWSKLFQN